MRPLAEKLRAKAAALSLQTGDEAGVKREESVHYLVDQWATFNLGRSVLTGLTAVLATWAAVEKLVIREIRVGDGVVR